MPKFLDNILKSIRDFWGKLTSGERLRYILILGAILVLSIILTVILSRTEYEVLYSGLPAAQAGEVLAVLDEMGIPYKTTANTILVPAKIQNDVAMRLAANDTLEATGFDYSVYQTMVSGMNVTDSDRRILQQLFLGQNIATTIQQSPKIDAAWVIITLPEKSAFIISEKNKKPSQAQITVKVANDDTLSDTDVYAITEIALASVPELLKENLSIVDTHFNYYTVSDKPVLVDIENQQLYKIAVQDQLNEQIQRLLTPIFGPNHFAAIVNAVLDFDRVSTDNTEWSPPVPGMTEGLAISSSKLYEAVRSGDLEGGIPGTDTNGLGTAEYPYGDLGDDDRYYKALEEINYELNELHTQTENAPGKIVSLSVGVNLDTTVLNPDIDYLTDVQEIVAAAIGVDIVAFPMAVSVKAFPFPESNELKAALELQQTIIQIQRDKDLIRLIIIGAILLTLLIIALVFLRSIVKTIEHRKEEEARSISAQAVAEADAARAAAGQFGYVPGIGLIDITIDEAAEAEAIAAAQASEAEAIAMADAAVAASEALAQSVANAELVLDEKGVPLKPLTGGEETKTEAMVELEKFIQRDAGSAVSMLRNWLQD
ncbi:MAG: flagellar M-ring protein FliF [Oscillospiraceae bacterium]|jgi:flagellar M-ring protein FliF|nr:flagellar M-ring protein FliF [Oscillospiraceae bacterium]